MIEFEPNSAFVAAILAIALLPAMILYRRRARRRTGALRFPSTVDVVSAGTALRSRWRGAVPALRVLAVALVLFALARPRHGDEVAEVATQGIAIQMTVDRSSSMWDNEMDFDGRSMPRLEVVKRIFKQFVLGDGRDLKGRPNDMIGLTTFARFAEEECPLTLDHGNLVGFVDTLTHAKNQIEDGTNISDAVYQAVLSLVVGDDFVRETFGRSDEYRIASKVIVLLTDGEQTRDLAQHSFKEAADLAVKNGIKIHSIAITGARDRQRGFFNIFDPRIDTSLIRSVAEATGGLYQEATDGDSLRRIYQHIDSLEKSQFQQSFRRYREQFAAPVLAALCCLALEVLLSCSVFRRIP